MFASFSALDTPGAGAVSRRDFVRLCTMAAPNGTWTADFKGQFKTRNGVYCYPLTIVDGFSRYLLTCHGLLSTAITTASRRSSIPRNSATFWPFQ